MKALFSPYLWPVLLVILLVADTPFLMAQQKTDSLKNLLATSKIDSYYVHNLISLAQAYKNSNPDSSLSYGSKGLEYAKKLRLISPQIQACVSIGYAWYMKGEYDKSIAAYRELYNTAAAIKDYKNMAIGLNNEANVFIEKGDLNHALDNYKKSLLLSQEINDDYGIARAYDNISYANKELGNYSTAIENYVAALKIFEQKNLYREISQCYNNIGYVYYRQKNYPAALDYTLRALAIQKEHAYKNEAAVSLEVLSNIYGIQQKYLEAIDYNRVALALHESNKDVRQVAINLSNMGELYNRQGGYDSAVFYYNKAITICREIGNKRALAPCYNGCAGALINNRQLKAAANMLDSAIIIIRETGRKEDLREYYATLSLYYAASGNAGEALDNFKKSTNIKDSLLNEQNTKIISEINTKYETGKKAAQIEKLNQEKVVSSLTIKNQRLSLSQRLYELAAKALELSKANLKIAQNDIELKDQQTRILKNHIDSIQSQQRIQQFTANNKLQQLTLKNQQLKISRKNTLLIVSVIIFVLLLSVVYISYRRYRLKQANRTQALLMKQQDIAAQDVIEAEEKERKRIAADLHDGVGQLMSAAKMNLSAIHDQLVFTNDQQRFIFESAITMVDEGCREVRNISHYMMPNALLKSGLVAAVREFVQRIADNILRIQLHAEGLDESIDKNTEIVLYRVMQECVNNVIKHSGATQLDIALIKDQDGISITVEDNGKGFNTTDIGNFNGLGLSNMIKRIEYLKGTIEWNSAKDKGTLVSIHIPE